MRNLLFALIAALFALPAAATTQTVKTDRATRMMIRGGFVPAHAKELLDAFRNPLIYDTAAELTAASPDEGTVGWAKDTNVLYFYTGSAWVGLGSASGIYGTNGGTIGNETNNVWTIAENDENVTLTFATNLATLASGTSATIAITPAVAFSDDVTISGDVAIGNSDGLAAAATEVHFSAEHQVPWFAKTTGAIMTEADTQEDYFRVGPLGTYFEAFQDGDNTDFAGTWGDGATGWVMPGPNAADQGFQITEGIVLGSAHSFTGGTDTAVVRVAFLINTRAELADLMIGLRALGAYAVGDDSAEIAAAYDDKVIVGIDGNAGAIKQMTSKATADVTTACTHAAAADGDILALEVALTAAGVSSVKVGTATPAGATTAQTQAAVTAALADLTADALCNAAAITVTAGEYVPTIMFAKTNNGTVSTNVLSYYYAGAE